jgi:hypothetical protein
MSTTPATETTIRTEAWVPASVPDASSGRRINWRPILGYVFLAALVSVAVWVWPGSDDVNFDRLFGYTIPWIVPGALFLIGVAAFKMPIGKGLLLAAALLAAWNVHAAEYVPSRSHIRMVKKQSDSFIQDRAVEIEQDTFKADDRVGPGGYRKANGHHDPNAWFMTALSAADEARDDGRRYSAVNARARDEDERIPQAIVRGDDTDWVTVATTQIPTRITVPINDEILPPWRLNEKTNADGRPFDAVLHRYDQTVLMKEHADRKLPMTDTGNVDELIGRFCHGKSCTIGFPLGSDSVVCVGPGFYDGGTLQTWRNGLAVQDQVPMLADFAAGGKYNLRIHPDDPSKGQTFATDVCNQHPGALVVQKPTLRVPTTTLVASTK